MKIYLARHVAAFNTFLANHDDHHPAPASPRELRSRDVIHLHHIVLYINIEACITLSELVFDNFPLEWTKAVDLADGIITSYINEFGSNLPNLVIDLGVSLPLSWISLKCRDFTLRQRAIDLLRRWPHAEGLHNTTILMNLGQAACEVESEALGDPVTGVVAEEARIRTVDIQVDRQRGTATLSYWLSDPRARHLVRRERVFDFEEPTRFKIIKQQRQQADETAWSAASRPCYAI
ncbi:hypothetical protein BJX62DRAFT_199415, partial [Aspergillus germanicus]